MSTNEQRTVLTEVFRRVLETSAFMLADRIEKAPPSETQSAASLARIGFSGPFRGTIEIAAPRDLCIVLAANVLGVEPADADNNAVAEDALREVLNVTCGNLLTALAGQAPVFDLTVPQTAPMAASEWDAATNDPEAVAIDVEGLCALLRLHIEEAPA